MDIRPGDKLDGPDGQRVEILSLCGSGGFGSVYSGQLSDGSPVAVKTLTTGGLKDDELKVLQREALAAQLIDHQHVVKVLYFSDGSATDGIPPYLVMEFVSGGSLAVELASRIAEERPFSPEELETMFVQIAEGMRAVNSHLIHRDLKPENVLISDDRRHLKIADFGLARLVDAATRSNTFKGSGTWPYMAPEVFNLQENTPAIDMYAAGVMFYEMAALQLPLTPDPGGIPFGVWRNAHLFKPVRPLQELRPDLPRGVSPVIMHMLEKDPRARPSSWEEIIRCIGVPGPVAPVVDLSPLHNKAARTQADRVTRETKAREAAERQVERRALQDAALLKPIEILRQLVDEFNVGSPQAKLVLDEFTPSIVILTAQGGTNALEMRVVLWDDIEIGSKGIARMVLLVSVSPEPSLSAQQPIQESMGSFNLVYRVADVQQMYGDWNQLRFERSPWLGESSSPHWFGLAGQELPRQLRALGSMGSYQHEWKSMGQDWFLRLIEYLL